MPRLFSNNSDAVALSVIVTGRPHTFGDGERQNPGVPLACPPFRGWRTAASINQQGGCMHHKRKRHKNARAGCLLCKPNKMNGWAKHRVLGHHGFGKLRREIVAQDALKEIDE